MPKGDAFTDAQVRAIKEALLRGSHPLALARHLKVSYNTIWRIKQGHTYNHVEVEGEDTLRPEMPVVGLDAAVGQAPLGSVKQVVLGKTEKELEQQQAETLERLRRTQEEVSGGRTTPVQTISREVAEKAQGFLGTQLKLSEGVEVAGGEEGTCVGDAENPLLG